MGVAPLLTALRKLRDASAASASVFLRDVGQGLLEVSHNTLALVGLMLAAVLLFAAGRADIRHQAEAWTLDWLQARQEAREAPEGAADLADEEGAESDAPARAAATAPKELSRQQAAIARWLSLRYRVAPEPMSQLVREAWSAGQKANLDPTLILAIMGIESSFNPFAQSPVGAQGLMQVMTKVHYDKYEAFGGNGAALDPVANMRVGVQVLKECIARAGGLEAGLRFYVGAGNLAEDGGYAGKVLNEQNALRLVAAGKAVPVLRSALTPNPAPAAPAPAKADATPAAPTEAAHPPEQVALTTHS